MAFTAWTISGNVADMFGDNFPTTGNPVQVWLEAYDPLMSDGTASLRLTGRKAVSVAANGAVSEEVAQGFYRMVFESRDLRASGRGSVPTGAFELTKNMTLAEIRDLAMPPSAASPVAYETVAALTASAEQAATEAEAAAATARDISNIDTTDTAVKTAMELPGSQSGAYLSATIAAEVPKIAPDKAKPASAQFAPPVGFNVSKLSTAYGFLAFDGDTIVATDNGSTAGTYVAKSTDSGATWTRLGQPNPTYSITDLWVSQAGTWFAAAASAGKVYRSTDKGVTWAETRAIGLMGEGWTQEAGGRIWVAQYGAVSSDANVYYSDDDGVSWTLAHRFPNAVMGDANPVCQHIHGIKALPSGVWVMAGDSNQYAGLWRWNGSTFTKQSPSEMDPTAQRWRTVGLTERDGWLYWIQDAADGGSTPGIFKAAASNLGGTITRVASLPTGGWYTAQTSDGTLLFGGVVEQTGVNNEVDTALRVWAVDEDDRVHEVFTTERTAGVGGTYTRVSSLAVRASDQTIGFRVGPVDWALTGTVLGKLRPGSARFDVTRRTAPEVYGATRRYWESTPATAADPAATTAGGTMPDMTVTIESQGKPVRIVATIPLYSASQKFNSVHLRVDGVVVPNTSYYYGGPTSMSVITIEAIHTPNPGSRTFTVHWTQQDGTSLFTSPGTSRRLRVYEL